ncbi:MAG: hypothetical protein RJB45_1483 [Pseudomonadota bacterium]
MAGVVILAHYPVAFLDLFFLFLGVTHANPQHQHPLILKEAFLVSFFLAGLVVIGGLQQWWLQPLLTQLTPDQLFISVLGLLGGALLPTLVATVALKFLPS